MPAVKLKKFLGAAPKISSELLPDGAGQTAYNTKLFSGDLLPYPEAPIVDSAARTGEIQTLQALTDPDTGALQWLSWLTDVDIVTASDTSDDEQRFYYTGDGVPKVSNFALATAAAEPYPNNFYELGLDLPTVKPSSVAAGFSTLTTSHYERDAANTAIIYFSTAHGLRTGNIITISSFTGSPADEFNATNARITVTSDTTFEYFNSGDAEAKAADTAGRVDLAGNTVIRQYVYTWYTPWSEESIASEATDELFMKEGERVTVYDLPETAPAGDNFIRGMRLYRTLASANGTEYYRLSTLWFPQATATVERTSNVATVTFADHHNFIVDDRFKLSGCTDSTFDVTDGIVVSVVDDTTITYASAGSDVASTADTTGVLYHDVSELPDDTARYWGDAIGTATRERTSNVATIETDVDHGLVLGARVTISGMTDTDYNATDAEVLSVPTSTTFTYANTAADEANTADTAGSVVNFSFTDDFDYLNLTDLLLTDEYDKPSADMLGITEGQNNVIAGFFDNQLCFAEPGQPHAWPIKYRRTFEYNIVAIVPVGGYILVLTEEYAYRVNGSDPATMAVARIDKLYPCLSKRGVVNMGYAALYPTHGGIALWSSSTGLALATNYVHDWDTWEDYVDPATINATYHKDKYYASHSAGAFIFERDDKVGGLYVTTNHTYTASYLDPATNVLYTVSTDRGDISTWDQDGQVLRPLEWKSKTIVTPTYMNLGAARVIADYNPTAEALAAITAYNDGVAAYNANIWSLAEQLGTVNGPTDYNDASGIRVNNFGELNSGPIHGDGGMTRTALAIPTAYPVTFELYVDKELKFRTTVSSDAIFRLPTGYRSDTFEVAVAGKARIRAIHLGETPHGMRKA
jgi:hypothetical protein